MGIIYFVQPPGCSHYKIGCSRDTTFTRVDSYGKTTRIISILKCENPFELESEIKKRFNFLFTLVHGNEWFQGDEADMLREFHDVYLSTSANRDESREREKEIERMQMHLATLVAINEDLKKAEENRRLQKHARQMMAEDLQIRQLEEKLENTRNARLLRERFAKDVSQSTWDAFKGFSIKPK